MAAPTFKGPTAADEAVDAKARFGEAVKALTPDEEQKRATERVWNFMVRIGVVFLCRKSE
jgi:hypothetical protein